MRWTGCFAGQARDCGRRGERDPPAVNPATAWVSTAWWWAIFEEIFMSAIKAQVRRFLVSEDGPTAVEYAVMLALILVACITIVTSLGTSVSGTFSRVNGS